MALELQSQLQKTKAKILEFSNDNEQQNRIAVKKQVLFIFVHSLLQIFCLFRKKSCEATNDLKNNLYIKDKLQSVENIDFRGELGSISNTPSSSLNTYKLSI